MKECKRYIRGYFTVEAAMILPVMLGVYVFIIVILMFQYDRCRLEQDMASMMIKAGNHCCTADEQLKYMQELTDRWDRKSFLWMKPELPRISIQGKWIKLSESAVYSLPLYGGIGVDRGEQQLELSYQVMAWEPAALVRILTGGQEEEEEDEP